MSPLLTLGLTLVSRGAATTVLLVVCLLPYVASGAVGTYSLYQSTNGAMAWERVGQGLPTNSRINALASVEQGVIAGTDAGVYVSNDAGKLWRPASKGPGTVARILSLATAGERIFAGTHQHGVLVSDDAGTMWRAVNSGLTDQYVRSLLAVGNRLFAGTDRSGVFVSEDVGKTWQLLSAGLPTPTQVFDLAAFDGTVFAGLYANGLYRLEAKESVWRKSGDVQPLELAATGKSLIVGHNPGGVFVSRDGGRNWHDGNVGLQVNVPIWTLSADETRVLAGATGKIGPAGKVVGLFRSTDHGHTWTRADQGLPGAAAAISFLITEEFVLAGIFSP